jgi:hypothetical protein
MSIHSKRDNIDAPCLTYTDYKPVASSSRCSCRVTLRNNINTSLCKVAVEGHISLSWSAEGKGGDKSLVWFGAVGLRWWLSEGECARDGTLTSQALSYLQFHCGQMVTRPLSTRIIRY